VIKVNKLEISRENMGVQVFNSNFLSRIWYHCGMATNFYYCGGASLLQPLCRSKEVKNFPHLSPTKGLFKDGLKMVQYGGAYGVLAGFSVVRGCFITSCAKGPSIKDVGTLSLT
jgi:hypothetical protein